MDKLDEAVNEAVRLDGVTQGKLAVNFVAVATAFAFNGQIAGGNEVVNNALYGALGNANLLSEIAHAGLGVGGDGKQDVSVVGEEGPCGGLGVSFGHR